MLKYDFNSCSLLAMVFYQSSLVSIFVSDIELHISNSVKTYLTQSSLNVSLCYHKDIKYLARFVWFLVIKCKGFVNCQKMTIYPKLALKYSAKLLVFKHPYDSSKLFLETRVFQVCLITNISSFMAIMLLRVSIEK